ncbi:unnamed protein product [Soboliphyme baturini]|uniref:Cation-transporting ATPase n=1 Tax=Soboliphyme baturini TaxID=241478 RepID=A0A183I9E9_9BILA|nr:unnamed protein product [Soboliphyme baturini]
MKLSFASRLSHASGNKSCVVAGDQSQLFIWGFRSSSLRIVASLVELLFCGTLTLVFYWKPEWRLLFYKRGCALEHADAVLIRCVTKSIFS